MDLLNVKQEVQLVAQHRPTAHALNLRQLGLQQDRCMDPCLGTLQRQRMAMAYNIYCMPRMQKTTLVIRQAELRDTWANGVCCQHLRRAQQTRLTLL
jgi:hypothetical protein